MPRTCKQLLPVGIYRTSRKRPKMPLTTALGRIFVVWRFACPPIGVLLVRILCDSLTVLRPPIAYLAKGQMDAPITELATSVKLGHNFEANANMSKTLHKGKRIT